VSDQKIRVYTFLTGDILTKLDELAASKGVSRSEAVRIAIEQYLTPKDGGGKGDITPNLTPDLTLSHQELTTLKGDITTKEQEITKLKGEVHHLKEQIEEKDSQLDQLKPQIDKVRSEANQAVKDRDQLRSEADQRWRDLSQTRSELNQAKRDIEAARSKERQLEAEAKEARSSKDDLSKELLGLQKEAQALKDTLAIKNDELFYLRGHLSQLTEKIPPMLRPSEEEIKAKHWWQFWRTK
jgi:chromosome segregation ATPase